MMIENGLIFLRIGTNGGLREGGNEPPGSLKARFLAVASWSKASRLGLAFRNARWFESSWGKKLAHEISTCVWDRCPPSIVMHLGSYDRKNDAETDQEEEKELVGSLSEKKLPTEGCTGRNGEWEKSSRQKKISEMLSHSILHADTRVPRETPAPCNRARREAVRTLHKVGAHEMERHVGKGENDEKKMRKKEENMRGKRGKERKGEGEREKIREDEEEKEDKVKRKRKTREDGEEKEKGKRT
ncbi:hypothetical protein ANN_00341 [Periplaneta americana]|uniref:Uncharacterized protein n=1 Tax=Periplaneta americana TaxID=6978 RepID=A0ABQ8TQS8_PERAM|nr:hypothetical protein ANN_00341 [Periplaneta americana]